MMVKTRKYIVSKDASEPSIIKMKKLSSSPVAARRSSYKSMVSHKMFGVTLQELVKWAPSNVWKKLPFILVRLCEFLNNNGLEQEGLFRVSGNLRVVEKLKSSFDTTGDADLVVDGDIMAVAGVLKLFLRELADGVFPESMTEAFLLAERDYSSDLDMFYEQLRLLLDELPEENYNVLQYLMRFLVNITRYEASNKMSAMALAIVFGPNLFRCGQGIAGLRSQGITNKIVYQMIIRSETLFMPTDESPPPYVTTFIKVEESKSQKTPPPRPPPPKLGATSPPPAPAPRTPKSSGSDVSADDLDDSSAGLLTPSNRTPRSNATIMYSPSDEENGRSSPFLLDSEAGHSIMESPVPPPASTEMVEKTINKAVSDFLFGDADVSLAASTCTSSVEELTLDVDPAENIGGIEDSPVVPFQRDVSVDSEESNNIYSPTTDDDPSIDLDLLPVKDRIKMFQRMGSGSSDDSETSNKAGPPKVTKQAFVKKTAETKGSDSLAAKSNGAVHSSSKSRSEKMPKEDYNHNNVPSTSTNHDTSSNIRPSLFKRNNNGNSNGSSNGSNNGSNNTGKLNKLDSQINHLLDDQTDSRVQSRVDANNVTNGRKHMRFLNVHDVHDAKKKKVPTATLR